MGSPARRLTNPITRCLTNPITRCWAHPNYGYAGTDDRQGTDQRLDTKRLTLMSVCRPNAVIARREPGRRTVPEKSSRCSARSQQSRRLCTTVTQGLLLAPDAFLQSGVTGRLELCDLATPER